MKARTFILTAGATFALVVPAANAAATKKGLQRTGLHANSNALYQARLHTVLYDQSHQAVHKSHVVKRGNTGDAAELCRGAVAQVGR